MPVDPSSAAAFLLIALLTYVTPGPDWFLVLRHAVLDRRSGFAAAAGVQGGLLVHTAAAALGVSAVLVASAEAFTVLKLAGAAYLVVLGLRSLASARRAWRSPEDEVALDEATARPWPRVVAQAFGGNVLNPKAALFFVAILPQFLDPQRAVAPQVVTLGLLDIGLGLAWWSVFVGIVARFHRVWRRRRARVTVDALSGVALTSLGAGLAATSR